MLWKYTRRDTKILLLATLCVFSAYALMLAGDWQTARSIQQESLRANSVGIYATVPETEESRIATELRDKERELLAREVALSSAEEGIRDTGTLWYVSIVGGVLFVLILLNFYLDHIRRRSLV
jgi:hypothetical protein